jgi:hypothetical protein
MFSAGVNADDVAADDIMWGVSLVSCKHELVVAVALAASIFVNAFRFRLLEASVCP